MTISSARIAELRTTIADMRERPPGPGMILTLSTDEIEAMLAAIDANGYAELFALNQTQADKIDALQNERDGIDKALGEARTEIARLETLNADQAARLEAMTAPAMGDDVVGDTPQS